MRAFPDRPLASAAARGRLVARAGIAWLAFLASVLLFAGFAILLMWEPGASVPKARGPLIVYCAAGIKAPVEAIAREYEAAYGVPVQLSYGGSQTLLTSLEVAKRGDLYLPGDDSYIQLARAKGLVAETIPLARMTAVLAVPKGNPKGLRTLEDLLRPGVKLAQANPDAAAIGKLTRQVLQQAQQWGALEKQTLVFKPTVNDVANDVKLGTVDAGIVWDAVLKQYHDLEAVPLPALKSVEARVIAAVLRHSVQPTAALRLARYLGARDKGLKEFARQGYEPVRGDAWAEVPELRLLGGAMLRPAIEETITAFEQREGVRVTRVYNGCGILVAQMRAGEHPDAYFACDASFMQQVHDLFLDAEDISLNQLVIIVPKGNAHRIKALKDLGQPGLRVGVGHEKQCALGVITKNTLLTNGVYGAVMRNVTVQSPTGDFLVNQLRTGSLDAVVAYVSNVATVRDQVEAIPVDVPCALATQPIAVGRDSNFKQLTGRLLAAIKSAESRQRFESNGFQWKVAQLIGSQSATAQR
jgi:molybdenum ABC transporter molybdate-binding protein